MLILSWGVLLPFANMQTELDSVSLAAALKVPHATAKRWLRAWYALGIAGVSRVPSVGRAGFRYAADPGLPDAWRAGLLPKPH